MAPWPGFHYGAPCAPVVKNLPKVFPRTLQLSPPILQLSPEGSFALVFETHCDVLLRL